MPQRANGFQRLREDLTAAGFTVDQVTDRLGPAAAVMDRDGGAAARHRLRGARDPLAVLISFWSCAEPVTSADLAHALPRTGLDGLAELGLARAHRTGESWRATCDLRPYAVDGGGGGTGNTVDTWIACDWGEPIVAGPLPPDHVPGVGAASVTLSQWTPRTPVNRALDLGTGCGVQAVALAGHAHHIVATDVDPRALGFARLTAGINGQTWQLRRGDLFDPVAAEQFDLVVANPPFVITPRGVGLPHYTYRDAGRTGDALMADLVTQVPAHLAPGGVAQFLGNWEIPAGADSWSQRPAQWLADTGLDAWVVQREVVDPALYAHTWIRDGGHRPGTSTYQQLTDAWLDDFERRGVAAIGMGILTLTRPDPRTGRSRAPYQEFAEAPGSIADPMGPAVAAGLAARAWLADHPPQAILEHAWRCAPDVIEERYARPGAEHPAVIRLTQGGGLRRSIQLDTVLAGVVSVCDGSLTAGRALHAVCALLGQDSATVAPAVLATLHELIAHGMLVHADQPGEP